MSLIVGYAVLQVGKGFRPITWRGSAVVSTVGS